MLCECVYSKKMNLTSDFVTNRISIQLEQNQFVKLKFATLKICSNQFIYLVDLFFSVYGLSDYIYNFCLKHSLCINTPHHPHVHSTGVCGSELCLLCFPLSVFLQCSALSLVCKYVSSTLLVVHIFSMYDSLSHLRASLWLYWKSIMWTVKRK